ncbi:hypothetical protein F5876DRAFT_75683 [Lentinula aff. lateritia]|uniref:Uncharacterized protein n=1 Tax=Lentinula aff. lateritia TaxID=2804960 RepID=A0ACC1U3Q9_9AGAR|nr:hypothetical protein F5876DRAFT_75683 [Lentinula aff. lateritia]
MIIAFTRLQLVLAFTAVSLSAAAALSQSSLESESTTSAPLLVLVTATSIAVSTAVQTSFTIVPGSSITSTDLVTATSHQSEASSLVSVATPSTSISSATRSINTAITSTVQSSTVSLSVGSGADKGAVPASSGFAVTLSSSATAPTSSGSALGAASNGAIEVYGLPHSSAVMIIVSVFASPVNLTSLYSPPRNFTPAPHIVTRDAGASQPAREKSANAILGYMYTDYKPRAREFNLHGFTTFPITEGSKFDTGADFPLGGGAYLEPVPWNHEVPGVWECVVSTEKQVILTAERVYIPTGFFARVGEFLELRKIPSGVYLLFGRYSKSRFKPHGDGSPFFMKILNRYLLQSPNYPNLPHAKENPLKLRVVCAEMLHAELPVAKWHTWKIDGWPSDKVV